MMLRKMGVPFFLMDPFSETKRLRGLLSCSLSALQFQSWTIGAKVENATIIILYHYINLQKKRVKDFSKIIKITEKLSIKSLKTWELSLNDYYWIYFLGSEINGGLLWNTHFTEQFLVSTCIKFNTVVPSKSTVKNLSYKRVVNLTSLT